MKTAVLALIKAVTYLLSVRENKCDWEDERHEIWKMKEVLKKEASELEDAK